MTPEIDADVRRLAGCPESRWYRWIVSAALLGAGLVAMCGEPAAHAREGVPPVIEPMARARHSPVPEALERLVHGLARAWVGFPPNGSLAEADPPSTVPVASVAAVLRPVSDAERRLYALAVAGCRDRAGERLPDPWDALAVLRLEEDLGVPAEYRGVTLAAWCTESGYGDASAIGDEGAAVGPLQLHAYLASTCGGLAVRESIVDSAWCWLSAIERVRAKSERRCGRARAWVVAQAWVSGGPGGYGCGRVSSHVRRLKRWQAGGAP